MELRDVRTKDLVRELLLRNPDTVIRIEVGTIMSVMSYHPHIMNDKGRWEPQPIAFKTGAESHAEVVFTSVDEAVEDFFTRYWKKADNEGAGRL